MVGDWHHQAIGLSRADVDGVRVERCSPDVGALRSRLAVHHPLWLVVGHVADEAAVQLLVMTAWQVYPDLRLAMLGPVQDLVRCQRWLRRGCHVYLSDSTPLTTMLTALDCAISAHVMVVDRAFYVQSIESRHGGYVPSLTARQHEVLTLIGRNLTNSEIAEALHVSDNTIEFHIRRLLVKLGARNRMHAVGRASDLGLI